MTTLSPDAKALEVIPKPHPWPSGHVFHSPGSQFGYRVIGPCCRLFDREQLPWPCCRLSWRSKEPSWRRIGRRFIADIATKRYPSYYVELLGYEQMTEAFVLTLYMTKLSPVEQDWWYTRIRPQKKSASADSISAHP